MLNEWVYKMAKTNLRCFDTLNLIIWKLFQLKGMEEGCRKYLETFNGPHSILFHFNYGFDRAQWYWVVHLWWDKAGLCCGQNHQYMSNINDLSKAECEL